MADPTPGTGTPTPKPTGQSLTLSMGGDTTPPPATPAVAAPPVSPLVAALRAKHPGVYDSVPADKLEAGLMAMYQAEGTTGDPALDTIIRPVIVKAQKAERLKTLGEYAPAIGGTVGGLAGGLIGGLEGMGVGAIPGAIYGAAGGATIGRGAERYLDRLAGDTDQGSFGDRLKEDLEAATFEGAIPEATGSFIVGPAITGIGKTLFRGALGRLSAKGAELYDTHVEDIVKTLTDNGVRVSRAGLAKLKTLIAAKNAELQALLGRVPGQPIVPTKAAQPLAELMNPAGAAIDQTGQSVVNQATPQADMKTLRATMQQFMHHPHYSAPTAIGTQQVPTGLLDAAGNPITKTVPVIENRTRDLSALEANKIKRGTTLRIARKARGYGEMGSTEQEAQKALGRGLREQIEAEAQKAGVGGVPKTNQEMADLIGAREAVARRLAAGPTTSEAVRWVVANPMTYIYAVAGPTGLPFTALVDYAMGNVGVRSGVALATMHGVAPFMARLGSPVLMRAAITALAAGEEPGDKAKATGKPAPPPVVPGVPAH